MKDDLLYVTHMAEAIRRIEEYTTGGREAFLASTLIQDAVVRNLQTMAESSQRLSEGLKARHPTVQWRGLAGFRNILVHNYLGVDLERIWQLVETTLPSLKGTVSCMLADLGGADCPQSAHG